MSIASLHDGEQTLDILQRTPTVGLLFADVQSSCILRRSNRNSSFSVLLLAFIVLSRGTRGDLFTKKFASSSNGAISSRDPHSLSSLCTVPWRLNFADYPSYLSGILRLVLVSRAPNSSIGRETSGCTSSGISRTYTFSSCGNALVILCSTFVARFRRGDGVTRQSLFILLASIIGWASRVCCHSR